MKIKAVSGIMLTLLFTSMLSLTFSVQLEDPAPDLSIEEVILMPHARGPYIPLYWPNPPTVDYSVITNVTNQGTADAGSFNVSFSAYFEGEEVPELWQKETITSLGQGTTETVSFELDYLEWGNFTFVITADCDNDIVELDETNNVESWWQIVTVVGDVNGDGDVDFDDFVIFTGAYGAKEGEPGYNQRCDFNLDGVINFDDFIYLCGKYGKSVF